jgi:hypothetical protein
MYHPFKVKIRNLHNSILTYLFQEIEVKRQKKTTTKKCLDDLSIFCVKIINDKLSHEAFTFSASKDDPMPFIWR